MTDNVTPTDRTLAAKLLDDLHEVTGGEWGPGAMVTAMKALSAAREQGRLEAEKKRVNEYANAARLIEWIENPGRKPANTAFTAGPERQVAYAIENLAEVYNRRSVLDSPEVRGLVEFPERNEHGRIAVRQTKQGILSRLKAEREDGGGEESK